MDKEYFEDAIAQLNTGLFQIETQTSDDDRRSLLAAQKAVRNHVILMSIWSAVPTSAVHCFPI